jgi:hypothetical protein
LRAPSAEGESKTHAGSIGGALLERAKDLFDIPTREPAALVLNLDTEHRPCSLLSRRCGLIARLCQFEHPIDCARQETALQQASEHLVARDGVDPKEALGLARRDPKARHFEILAADTADEVGSWIDGGDNRHGPS